MGLKQAKSPAAAALGVLVTLTLSAGAHAALLTEGPPITNVAVSDITRNGATVTAVINPEGTETKYRLELQWKEKCAKKHCKGQKDASITKQGTLPAVNENRRVSVHVSNLKAETHYTAYFSATNSAAERETEHGKGFTTK